jgi:tetratricopeptide (TPR) repeat protein
MTTLQYLDFELMIEREGQQFQATVVRSPVGEASHIFDLPFSDLEVENFVLRLGATRRGIRRISSPEMQHARQFGSRLFEAVFRGDVRAGLVSSQHEAARRGLGLRLKLRLEEAELINLPWEYLYDDSLGRFLSLFEDTPIVRYVDMRGNIVPLSVSPPLSILVMISRPSDRELLDVDRERANLQSALSGLVDAGMLTVTMMEQATLPSLAESLLRGCYHVFHYIGHGGFDERNQDGVLILEDEGGRGRLTSGERLAVLLGNHPTLRLVLLNACEGARTSRDDPFAGTATTLVRTGRVPAVVAMQFPISDEAAITFARGFYTALSVGRPVDASVTQARLAIFADDNDVEWGTPVLYMRAPDGRIFDVESLAPESLDARRRAAKAARAEREAAERQAQEQQAVERAQREAKARQEAALAEIYDRAAVRIEAGDWRAAERLLRQIQETDQGYRDVEARLARVTSERETLEQIATLQREAEEACHRADWQRAGELYAQVLALNPGDQDVQARWAEVQGQQQLAEQYRQAMAHLEAQRWQEAIEGFEAIVEMDRGYGDPAHGSAADLLNRARQEKKRAGMPGPPDGRRRPTSMPEEIKPRGKPKDLPA